MHRKVVSHLKIEIEHSEFPAFNSNKLLFNIIEIE